MRKNQLIKILKLGMLSFTFIFCLIAFSYAQNAQEGQKKKSVVAKPFSIKLNLLKEPEDKRGTDVKNIYNIQIGFADKNLGADQKYDVAYFVDGRLVEELKNQSLPFSLKRNFKGFISGPHEVKIEILDGAENVLSSAKITLEVVH